MQLSRLARTATLVAMAGLIGGLVLWLGPLYGPLTCLPLLPALPGLWRGRRYTYGWTSLLSLTYLTVLLTEFTARGASGWVTAPALLATVIVFTGCLCFVRWQAREQTPPPTA